MAQLKDLIVNGASRFLGNIYGTLKGNADTSTKATQDSSGQQINTTYIKGLSASGKTVTYTKGDGTTGTITTQDTTYSNATTSAAGLMSKEDKTKLDNLGTLVGSTSVSTQINNKISSIKGAANGLAELDSNGKVPSTQLPSYVDDVLEYNGKTNFPSTGETGKIYVDSSTNLTYRWSGSAYVEISPSLALGTTSSTAFRGDYGNTAYTHATAKGSAFSSGLYKITTNAQGHVTAATAVAKSDITGLGIPAQDTTYSAATTSAAGLMSASDKTKLDGIATGATKVIVDSALSSTSTNPVQNKVVNTAITNLNTLVGSTSVSEQISTAIEAKITPTILEENSDLNNLTTAGLYSQMQITKAQTIVNNPLKTADTGILVKVYNTNNNAIYQELHGIKSGGIYKRRYSSGSWSEWIEIATVDSTVAKANKLATARTIAIGGGAIGTATSFDGSGNITIPITSIKPEYISYGYVTNRVFLNTSINNNGVVIPYVFNDIAHLLKKGGSAIVYYDNTQASTNIQAAFSSDFDYWSKGVSNITKIVFELTLDKVYTNANTVYLDSGNPSYRAKDIKIEVMDSNYANDIWTTKVEKTNKDYSYMMETFSHTPKGASSTSFNKMRITFSNFASSTFRIACIGLLATNNSKALTEVCLSKAGGNIYGSITPYANATYNLGSSTNKFSAVYANTFNGTASYAVRDTNGSQIDTTYVKKSGSTMNDLNSLLASASTTTAISPEDQAIASSPFSRDLWHDHFAFLIDGYSIVTNETTTDQTTWTSSSTTLKGLFQQKDKTAIQILGTDELARRFTLRNNSKLPYSSIRWYEIGVAYNNPFSNFEIHIEASTDNSTWTTIHKSTITSNSKPFFLKGEILGGNTYLRFTFTKKTNITTGLVSLTCIKGFTMRKGDQGLGIENEYPYNWDANRNIFPHTDNARSLGTSTLRWANVYATNFVGTASKATSDANGNNIANTYAKKPTITTQSLSVPITGWTLDSTYQSYSQSFTVNGATTTADIFIDCITGLNFPLIGARCTTTGSLILYMSEVPTTAQTIKVKFREEK